MIARVWSAETSPAQAPAYATHLRNHVLPAVRAVDGYAGAMLLQRRHADTVDLIVLTFWQSMAAIREFAGADVEAAVVADAAAALLNRFERRVRHYEVVLEDRT